jgi:hypothetical protein
LISKKAFLKLLISLWINGPICNKLTMKNYLSNGKFVMSMVIFQRNAPIPPLKSHLKNLNNGNILKGKKNKVRVRTLKPPPCHPYLIHPKTPESSIPNLIQDPPRVELPPLQNHTTSPPTSPLTHSSVPPLLPSTPPSPIHLYSLPEDG